MTSPLTSASSRELWLVLYYTLFYFPYCATKSHEYAASGPPSPGMALVIANIVCFVTGALVLWLSSALLRAPAAARSRSAARVLFCVLFVGSLVLMLVLERFYPNCSDRSRSWSCAGELAKSTILIVPVVLASTFQDLSEPFVWSAYTVCAVAQVATEATAERPDGVAAAVAAVVLTGAVLLTRTTGSFVLPQLPPDRENSIVGSHTFARHLIANVAHDLKTPVSSFMAGVEGIAAALDELSDVIAATKSSQISTSKVCEAMAAVHNYARLMRNTNNFMLMTIHRCMDYTKASKGMKLVPKHETIDLAEALALPMSCMKDIQERVSMRMDPLPRNICGHIITDKQWLQENVLCLLSNAVKYSSGGVVTVGVRMDSGVEMRSRGSFSLHRMGGNSSKSGRQFPAARVSPDPDLALDVDGAVANMVNLVSQPDNADEYKHVSLRVEVEDMGIGMTEDAMRELFSPFKQTQRLAGGTGLGLFSLAQRVEALHGKCGVQRRRDGRQGSLFWFSIPYRPDFVAVHMHHEPGTPHKSVFETILERESPQSKSTALYMNKCASSETIHTVHTQRTAGEGSVFGWSKKSTSTTLEAYSVPDPASCVGRVLLVDDSHMILRLTTMALRRLGFAVTAAENGAEALRVLEDAYDQQRDVPPPLGCLSADADILGVAESKQDGDGYTPPLEPYATGPLFDAVLMDLQVNDGRSYCVPRADFRVQMPVMDGLEATRRLRRWEEHLPSRVRHLVIGVSANTDDETLEEARLAGFDSFLPKPFNVEMFQKLMRQRDGSGASESPSVKPFSRAAPGSARDSEV